MGSKAVTSGLLLLFALIVVFSLLGLRSNSRAAPKISWEEPQGGANNHTLFVLIHGFEGAAETWVDIRQALATAAGGAPLGDIVACNYDAGVFSNVDPTELAESIVQHITQIYIAAGNQRERYEHVTLVGYSAGALIARQAYLIAAKRNVPWIAAADRIVLLAGMNRGWDISGRRPLDMSRGRRVKYWLGTWLGRFLKRGSFILDLEMGAPFVADLRLEWMRWFRASPPRTPTVVQLLGDIDDVVSDEDNKDIRATAGTNFHWLRVRGTGHLDIINFHDNADAFDTTYHGIGPYRKRKFILAVTGTPAQMDAESEELPYQTDNTVTQIVFVLHGIRDLGRWSAQFEEQLRISNPPVTGRRMIVSVRYGFFSMAAFLFRPDRQKFVRWFMDQYTETLAKYPNATTIDFVGHSNGTYLLASALECYPSMKIRRIAFAGSVVRRNYPWDRVLQRQQVEALRNYMGSDDAVVALFPRFFETWPARWMGNDVGSGGFNGFSIKPNGRFDELVIPGGHSAFHHQIPQIVQFITAPQVPAVILATQPATTKVLRVVSLYFDWLVWAGLLLLIGYPAARVAIAGGQYAWLPLGLYLWLVIALLSRL